MRQYKCEECGEVFQVKDGVPPVCPRCHASGDRLKVLSEIGRAHV